MSLWRQLTRGLRVLTHRAAADRDIADEVQHYLDQRDRRVDGPRLSARRGAPRRAAGDRQHHGRPRTGPRLRLGERRRRRCSPTCATRARRLRAYPGLRRRQRAHARARHRREHGHLQRRQPDPVRAAALSAGRPDRHDLGSGWRRRAASTSPSARYRELRRPQPIVRRARRDEAVAADDDRTVRAGAARRPARERRATSACSACARRSAAISSRPTIGCNGPRVVILSDAVWRRRFGARPGDRRTAGHARRDEPDRDRRDAAGFENVLAPAADVWAPLQYDPSLPHGRPRVGPSPADRRHACCRASASIARRAELDAIAPDAVPAIRAAGRGRRCRRGSSCSSLQDDVTQRRQAGAARRARRGPARAR